MTRDVNDGSSNDPHLERLIARYLQSMEAGETPDRERLLSANPELADSLRSFFLDHDGSQKEADENAPQSTDKSGPAADSESQTLPPTQHESEAPTLHPRQSSENSDHITMPPDGGNTSNAPIVGTNVRYFGDYELLEEIARGGMGVVYRARQVTLNRIVALKMILAGQLAGEEDVRRFHAEAEAAAQLDHPGIVPIFDVGEHEGQHYFSMGFVEGGSLADRLQNGPLPPGEAAEYVCKVATAVAYAHERGVIHRDLKPGNVLLDGNDNPKVTDFGLAKRMEGDSDLTATGQILGTPSYMPPEQASANIDEIGPPSDVYSIGAILYCLLTGRPPFQAASPMDTLLQVLDKDPISPSQLAPNVPLDLETICLKCLQKKSSGRYENARDLGSDLERFVTGRPVLARPPGTIELAAKWLVREPIAGSAILGCILVVVVQPFPAFFCCSVIAGLLIGRMLGWSWIYAISGATMGIAVGLMDYFKSHPLSPKTSSPLVHTMWWVATCVLIGFGIRSLILRADRHAKVTSRVIFISITVATVGYAVSIAFRIILTDLVIRSIAGGPAASTAGEEILVSLIFTLGMQMQAVFLFVAVVLGGISTGMLADRISWAISRRTGASQKVLDRLVAFGCLAACFTVRPLAYILAVYSFRLNEYLPVSDGAGPLTQFPLLSFVQLVCLSMLLSVTLMIPYLLLRMAPHCVVGTVLGSAIGSALTTYTGWGAITFAACTLAGALSGWLAHCWMRSDSPESSAQI